MNYIDKINKIIDLLINKENEYSNLSACYWKIGTSIFKMFDHLFSKIEKIYISKVVICKKILIKNNWRW